MEDDWRVGVIEFQLTRPLRGVTRLPSCYIIKQKFQLTRPLRGVTQQRL